MFTIYKCEKLANSLSPVFSTAFAFSGSGVFTINVRPLSVNTSINTAQRFTSYASFWLSHLLKERAREKTERTEKKGMKRHVSVEGVTAMCLMQNNNINSSSTLDANIKLR